MTGLTLFLALAPIADPAPAQAPAAAGKITVPMEILPSKHIAVQIKVNGKGPYRVIFDTGSPVTLLSNRVAQEAGLVDRNQARMPALFGARGMGTAKTLELGELAVQDQPVMIMDHPALRAAGRVLGPLDGIVGYPLFSRFRTTFDYQNSTLSFEPVSYRDTGGLDLMQMVMVMMNDRSNKPVEKMQSPATLWGLRVGKPEDDQPGVVIEEVFTGSPAARAGLQAGDRLLELDGTWTESVEDTYRAASAATAGQPVVVKVRRGDQEICVTLTPKAGL
jgi:membrane-associated protease RseP (regulator of RpoE activity)